MSLTLKSRGVYLIGLLVAALALVAAGCGGDDGGGAPEALPSSSCTAIEYEGDGNPDYIIASDLPLQGASRTQTLQINEAIRKVLADREYKAGDYNIGFQACDDATAQAGKWDSGKCSQNANAYAANDKVIGVIGTFNSGCAAIIIPVLNQAPDGGIAMMSPANTYPCLTVNLPGGCDATRAGQVLPDGRAELRARRAGGRLPGRCRGGVHEGEGRHEALRPERQGGLRPRRRNDHAEGRRASRHRGRRLRGVGSEGRELRVAVQEGRGAAGRTQSSSAA